MVAKIGEGDDEAAAGAGETGIETRELTDRGRFTPNEAADGVESGRVEGGTYGELKSEWKGELLKSGREIHHIPAFDSAGVVEREGYAIVMDSADHRALNSTGYSDHARAWRNDIEETVEAGDFKTAMDTEIAEIQTRFPDKYDAAISQMLEKAMLDRKYPVD